MIKLNILYWIALYNKYKDSRVPIKNAKDFDKLKTVTNFIYYNNCLCSLSFGNIVEDCFKTRHSITSRKVMRKIVRDSLKVYNAEPTTDNFNLMIEWLFDESTNNFARQILNTVTLRNRFVPRLEKCIKNMYITFSELDEIWVNACGHKIRITDLISEFLLTGNWDKYIITYNIPDGRHKC